jgi:hypothetical protein
MDLTVDLYRQEVSDAVTAFDRYVVCIDKTPDQFKISLISLIEKGIKAYQDRAPALRHGIALDRHVTVILSQTEGERPVCGIYFNLHSPYQKKTKTADEIS